MLGQPRRDGVALPDPDRQVIERRRGAGVTTTSSTLRHVGFGPPSATLEAATAPAPRPDCAMQPVRTVPNPLSDQTGHAIYSSRTSSTDRTRLGSGSTASYAAAYQEASLDQISEAVEL